ncbi:MAG: peptide chain release factor 1 [Spirochaetes bacterium]|nr:peptide chain release factor 1 [Spirochaetota bacterium]
MQTILNEIKARYNELESMIIKPEIIADQKLYKKLTMEHSRLIPVVQKYQEFEKTKKEINDARELIGNEKDQDMKDLLKTEIAELEGRINILEKDLTILLLPKDPNSGKNILIEIRAGTGGDEAALFARDLFRMYSRYTDASGWKMDVISANATGKDGLKEIIFSVIGSEAYDNLKFESGTHRVQRVPETEASGRIHTSAVTVAVLPEAEESDIEIDPEDLRIDVYRSSGHGGQSVNTTDSAVRITHIPSGLVVTCQDEKSQLKNKTKALKILRARLFEIVERERMAEESQIRKSQIGSGDRSEKIRTYNFPQSRVTDHRIGLTLHSLEKILDGEIDDLVDNLKKFEQEQLLKSSNKK